MLCEILEAPLISQDRSRIPYKIELAKLKDELAYSNHERSCKHPSWYVHHHLFRYLYVGQLTSPISLLPWALLFK